MTSRSLWIDDARGHVVDWSTQRWVQATGRRVSLAECPWLEHQLHMIVVICGDFLQLDTWSLGWRLQMRFRLALALIVAAAAVMATIAPAVRVTSALAAASQQKSALSAPDSVRTEHEHIHAALEALTQAPGQVGMAAKALASTLHPHFVREEEIALPLLGLLAPLAAGQSPAGMEEGVRLSDMLRKEMPRMLREHEAIRAAVDNLLRAARSERHAAAEEFCEALSLHARTEEDVTYPAAMLVGDVIRVRALKR